MEIECANCDRKGRYKVSRLIEKWGADMPIATFIASLGMTCPRYVRASKFDSCGIGCQQLIYMFQKAPFTEEFRQQDDRRTDRR